MNPLAWLHKTDRTRFLARVRTWYRQNGRQLPWRSTRDPYQIWVSEIMLQQTQVATAAPYFLRFINRFPTLHSLAAATEIDVLRAWQGLGYYRRARDMHQAARRMVLKYHGVIPTDIATLQSMPGIGRYTAAAIASFAFGKRVGVLEANTIRLWTRICAAGGEPQRPTLHDELWSLADRILPVQKSAEFNQALIELGALVCRSKAPQCPRCPVRTFCRAWRMKRPAQFPSRMARSRRKMVEHIAVAIWRGNRIAVVHRPDGGPWAGLWELPRVERRRGESAQQAACRAVALATDRPCRLGDACVVLRHSYTRFRVRLVCYEAILIDDLPMRAVTPAPNEIRWRTLSGVGRLALSTPQRKVVAWLRANRNRRAASRAAEFLLA